MASRETAAKEPARSDVTDRSIIRGFRGVFRGSLSVLGGYRPDKTGYSDPSHTLETNNMLDLEAIELIKQLKARYFRFIDTCNLDGLKSIFTEDALIHFNSPTYDIRYQGWAELEKFYRNAFTPNRFGMHQGHGPEITVNGDRATGYWYLHDIFFNTEEKTIFQGSALYEDEYVKENGVWRIKTSTYKRLLEVISPLTDDIRIAASPVR